MRLVWVNFDFDTFLEIEAQAFFPKIRGNMSCFPLYNTLRQRVNQQLHYVAVANIDIDQHTEQKSFGLRVFFFCEHRHLWKLRIQLGEVALNTF